MTPHPIPQGIAGPRARPAPRHTYTHTHTPAPAGGRARSALATLAAAALLAACGHAPKPREPSAFERARPASLLVLPPINDASDVRAPYAVLSQVTRPLAEGGYYVLPVSVTEETFRQNGMQTAHDIHAIPLAKLREIFGADAVLYLQVKDYGPRYTVLQSETRATVAGRIVDLRSGITLWTGQASASSLEGDDGRNAGGLIGALVVAVVKQVAASVADNGAKYAAVATQRLLTPRDGAILPGPRAASAPGANGR